VNDNCSLLEGCGWNQPKLNLARNFKIPFQVQLVFEFQEQQQHKQGDRQKPPTKGRRTIGLAPKLE
jgi:hypothetical protein